MEGREDTTAGGTSWERVARLVDVGRGVGGKGGTGEGSGAMEGGKEGFRRMLLGLRGDEGAPGAGGY